MQKDLKPMENGEITHLNKSHHGCQGSNKYEIGFDKSASCARDATYERLTNNAKKIKNSSYTWEQIKISRRSYIQLKPANVL